MDKAPVEQSTDVLDGLVDVVDLERGDDAGAGIASVGHSSGSSDVAATHQQKTKVVVVGAGMAGMTAAAKLIHNGIRDVVVLEAQDYVGGRIQAHAVGDQKLDMGAMFVHGQLGSPIYEIVQRMGKVIDEEGDTTEFFYTSKRDKAPVREVEDLIDFIGEQLNEMEPMEGESKGEYLTSFYNQFLLDHQISDDHVKKELYDAAYRWFCFYDCTEECCNDLREVSAYAGGKYVKFPGNQHTLIKGGYTTVIQALLDLIPQGVIRTGTPVDNIDWNRSSDEGIIVRCANGDVISTDHVIVTISMGCLKAVHGSMFSPSLPNPFLESIHKLEFGTIGKIFLKFDTPFWNKSEGAEYNFLWLESHPITLKQDISKRKSRFGKPWWQYINGCHTMPENDDCLLFWLLQHQLEAIKDLSDQEVMAILHELIQELLYDTHVTMPCAVYRTNWGDNPYTRGAYTYPRPSFDTNDEYSLTRPTFPSIQNPRLMFAGESYTMEYMTTTHGAFITGEYQAENVLKANGITDTIRVVDAIAYD